MVSLDGQRFAARREKQRDKSAGCAGYISAFHVPAAPRPGTLCILRYPDTTFIFITVKGSYTPCITGCICLPSRASFRVFSMSPVRAIMEVGFFTGSSWPKGTK